MLQRHLVRNVVDNKSNSDETEDWLKFVCSVCGLAENCRYGLVEVSVRTHTYRYKDEMYYILDPFRNRNHVDERRMPAEKPSYKSSGNNSIPNILDIFVIGALCSSCGQPVCIDEICSVFYTKTFCTLCLYREKSHFPKEFVEQTETVRKQRQHEQKKVEMMSDI
ncbi:unnamed protein product [Thelazia callipaeda]|uniref:Cysteine-rich DPF motif domain-containing protein 1 n=1 Tax=Thelazia callipaeda TaxID=103827 RepID=A0A0N5CJS3_THECL|nr:unnamed protein product [Thelazia callipaeda]